MVERHIRCTAWILFSHLKEKVMKRLFAALFCSVLLLVLAACAQTQPQQPESSPLVVLDPGHGGVDTGGIDLHGKIELSYNTRFTAELASALVAAGWRVQLTRQANQTQYVSLPERAAIANALQADLLLSIHHDAMPRSQDQEQSQQPAQAASAPMHTNTMPTTQRGYALFVSKRNSRFTDSQRFAQLLGQQLRALGRAPVQYKDQARAVDAQMGIYKSNFAVISKANMPAVHLEVGVITDPIDSAYVNDPANRQAMVQAIVRAMTAYTNHRPSSAVQD